MTAKTIEDRYLALLLCYANSAVVGVKPIDERIDIATDMPEARLDEPKMKIRILGERERLVETADRSHEIHTVQSSTKHLNSYDSFRDHNPGRYPRLKMRC